MREDTINTRSILEKLSRTAITDDPPESDDGDVARDDRSSTGVEHELEALLADVTEALSVEDVAFEETLVKENLDEILLVLIALHEETHGDELLTDIEQLFDTQLSPGTVYPLLHDLEESDTLSMQAKVRTKEYSIADRDAVRADLEDAMVQHLAFGMLLYAFLHRY
ncbi:PadR family transcriptional regulator [Salinadaptatus halalkaliphilus]|uniref:PadR family transcriptional regulator n=1 Tax=Salinadaptatus halalkaliphilus TaxID=2419781 RepID=A0A4S3TME1_9EURY|nr:helix-turn-helix transcriptional regulator [Salinadaptatus halalkaliphilus]THE65296.1 PadR family transcriptional regulator [Salinadaptatus halalkaliphilus]